MVDLTPGTLVHLDPNTLLLQRNIRDAAPSPELVDSITQLGVRVPITAVLTTDNQPLVRTGHRRTLAAIAAKRTTVPVYIEGTDSLDDTAEITRIIVQRDENTHRSGLTTLEEATAISQLAAFGLTAAQITAQARISKHHVHQALSVADSTTARTHTATHDLTLDQAATLAEFDHDPDAVEALLAAAERGQFDHHAQRLRDDQQRQQWREHLTSELTSHGITVISPPGYNSPTTLRLSRLHTQGQPIEDHTTCPGHVAWLEQTWVRVDTNGNIVEAPDEPGPDACEQEWDAHEAILATYEATTRHVQYPSPVFGCENYQTHGHTDSWTNHTHTSARPKAADMTSEEREQAKAQRRQVIENNKAWAAAEPVRQAWVARLAKAKTSPKQTVRFIATALSKDAALLGSFGANRLAGEWLGRKELDYGRYDLSPTKSASDTKCLINTLTQVLAAYEDQLHASSWREDGTTNAAGRYLRFLQSAGYPLSDVESYTISNQTL